MYKFDRNHQFKLSDFSQSIGLKMNLENRWVKKPLRTALGSHVIQKQYEYSDRELVEQIRETPYY